MEVKDQNGKLVAKGLATYMIISPGKKEQSGYNRREDKDCPGSRLE